MEYFPTKMILIGIRKKKKLTKIDKIKNYFPEKEL